MFPFGSFTVRCSKIGTNLHSNPWAKMSAVNSAVVIDGSAATASSSPMQEFYRDKVIFMTGATGVLGELFVEKLLRFVFGSMCASGGRPQNEYFQISVFM